MENTNIVLVKHHFVNYQDPKYTTFYLNQCPDLKDRVVIDVTSRCVRNKEFMREHPSFAKDISPMFVGPVYSTDGMTANTFEHFWQTSKVYPCHVKDGKVLPEYFNWRNKWFDKDNSNRKDDRYPCQELGYKNSDALFCLHYENGEYQKLPYISARKKVYFPVYAKLISESESYLWMESLLNDGKKLALLDFDGYNYYSEDAMRRCYVSYLNKCKSEKKEPLYSERDFLNVKSMKDVVNCPFLLAGHGFVLKALLQGDIEVINGEVIDRADVLQ